MHEWLTKGTKPYPKTLAKLVSGTGYPAEWWLSGDGPPPSSNQAAPAITYETASGALERRGQSTSEPVAASRWTFDAVVFSRCRQAWRDLFGEEFMQLTEEVQDQYAGELYSLLDQISEMIKRPLGELLKAERTSIAGFLGTVHQMGWVRRFPDRRHSTHIRSA
jgi:hypothetical protein